MASRDEILKAWDKATSNFADPTHAEIAAASAIVCAKLGVEPDDIRDALRASVEELEGELASTDRALEILKEMAEEREGTLPGLPGGPPLKPH